MKATTEFYNGRYWTNVGHACTRCLHTISTGEKAERFVTKGGRLRARHVGKCPGQRPRKQPVFPDIPGSAGGPRYPGCGCDECLTDAAASLLTRYRELPYLNQLRIEQAYVAFLYTRDRLAYASRRRDECNPGSAAFASWTDARQVRTEELRDGYATFRPMVIEQQERARARAEAF